MPPLGRFPFAVARQRGKDLYMARNARELPPQDEGSERPEEDRKEPRCSVCGTKLSAYNPGPNCWQHTIGYPWRGPSAKPRYD
jgi:hypothetical protein